VGKSRSKKKQLVENYFLNMGQNPILRGQKITHQKQLVVNDLEKRGQK